MNCALEFCINRASATQIATHLRTCDVSFVPPLSGRVAIDDYAYKIANRAMRFEAWANGDLVGLVATYCNDSEGHVAFITNVSVLPEWHGKGVASQLVERCIGQASEHSFACIELEVAQWNVAAIRLYEKHGFSTVRINGESAIMQLAIGK